jgi:hypothetical protein
LRGIKCQRRRMMPHSQFRYHRTLLPWHSKLQLLLLFKVLLKLQSRLQQLLLLLLQLLSLHK